MTEGINRNPHAGIDTSGTAIPKNSFATWTTAALARDLVLTGGTIDVHVAVRTEAQASVQVALFDGATQVGQTSVSENLDLPTPQVALFQKCASIRNRGRARSRDG